MVWVIVENFTVLLHMEQEMAEVGMPDHPKSAKVVKEFMILEGDGKVMKQWKDSDATAVVRGLMDMDSECCPCV